MSKYIATLMILLILILSCKKKCKEEIQDTYLTNSQLTLIPFKGTETVIFEDGSGNEISFTGEGYVNSGPFVDKYNCPDKFSEDINLSFSSPDVDYKMRYTLRFWSGKNVGEDKLGLEMVLFDKTHTNILQNYLPFPDIENSSPTYSSKTINSKTFADIYEFKANYMTLYYNKQYGVIGMQEGTCCDQQNLKIWNLKN